MEEAKIMVTVEEFEAAVAKYDLIMTSELEDTYKAMLAAPAFGIRVASALQVAITTARTKEQKSRVLDAAVLPAFIIGMLVGRAQGNRELAQSDTQA